jgi:hypothetical protein
MSTQRCYVYAILLIALTSFHLPCTDYTFDISQAILNKEKLTHKFYQQHFLPFINVHNFTFNNASSSPWPFLPS